jgi:hypothetical protein
MKPKKEPQKVSFVEEVIWKWLIPMTIGALLVYILGDIKC